METTDTNKTVEQNKALHPDLFAYFEYSRKYSIRPRFLDDLCEKAFVSGASLSGSQLDKAMKALAIWPEERLKLTEEQFSDLGSKIDAIQGVTMGYVDESTRRSLTEFFQRHSYLSAKQIVLLTRLLEHYKRQVTAGQTV